MLASFHCCGTSPPLQIQKNDGIEQSPAQGGIIVEGDPEQLNGDSVRSDTIGISTRLQHNYVCESKREKVLHDDRGNTLPVGKGKNRFTIIIILWYLQLTTGIVDDPRVPSAEGMMIERY